MAQPEISETTPLKPFQGGYYQYINFGKHSGKTFYDLANEQEFKYLQWCNLQAKNKLKKKKDGPSTFQINPNCIPHIQAALRTQHNPGTWVKEIMPLDIRNHYIVQYKTDTGILGPSIKYIECVQCKQKKNKENSQEINPRLNLFLCSKCSKDEETCKENISN